MKHKMKLNPKYYNYILKGTKRIELRLYNEKRKNIKVNDILKCYVLNNSYNICKENMLEIYL